MSAVPSAIPFDFGKEAAKEARKVLPVCQLEGHMVFGDLKIPICLDAYGQIHRRFAGSRETPEEPSFFEPDRLMLSSRDGEVDILPVMGWSDVQDISDKIMGEI